MPRRACTHLEPKPKPTPKAHKPKPKPHLDLVRVELRGRADPHGLDVGVVDHVLRAGRAGTECAVRRVRGVRAAWAEYVRRGCGVRGVGVECAARAWSGRRGVGVCGVELTMASPEYLGSLYFSAAALALATVGLEMITGLALSNARRNTCEQQICLGGPCLLSGGLEPSVGSRLAARERLEMHEADAASADHTCMCAGGHRMHTPRGIAWHCTCIASGLTDVQHPIGQSHADRSPPSGGDTGPARAGQLQRMGGHSQRHRGDADADHRADLRSEETRPGRDGARGRNHTTRPLIVRGDNRGIQTDGYSPA